MISPIRWSSNFGHRIPGVSRSSTDLFRRIHWFPLVTPGLFPVFAVLFPAMVLIRVDFPTFGTPATMARSGRFRIPRFLSRSRFSAQTRSIRTISLFRFFLLRPSMKKQSYPAALKYFTHS